MKLPKSEKRKNYCFVDGLISNERTIAVIHSAIVKNEAILLL